MSSLVHPVLVALFLTLFTFSSVDELDQCNEMVGNVMSTRHVIATNKSGMVQHGAKSRKYFPFKQGYLSVATLRVGSEGIQMTVDGRHITSFAFREVIFSPHFSFSPLCFLKILSWIFLHHHNGYLFYWNLL